MNKCYIVYPKALKIFYIAKALEKKGFEIIGLNLYDEDLSILNKSEKIKKFFIKKSMTDKDLEDFFKIKSIFLRGMRNKNKIKYLESIQHVQFIKDLSLKKDDKLFCFEERFIFESSMLDKNFISPRYALLYSCKHMVYNLLKRKYYKIYTIKDFDKVPEGKYIFKPSIDSVGKRNVFILENNKDYKKILDADPDIFSLNRVFILEKYIKNVSEIWAMTLFDDRGEPYILWFSTEKNHATFSVFENDLYKKIKEINSKLKIKKWMAYIQFLVDEEGELHFVDLNPRLPGDDDWHELLYRYLTGKSFAKTIVDLIIDGKTPTIIKTKKYIQEDEYDPSKPIQKNQRMWDYPDNYKEKPLLTFKKLDI